MSGGVLKRRTQIERQLGQLDSKSKYKHQYKDPNRPPAPKGTRDQWPENETISGLLNACLTYLEEFTTGVPPNHVARPQGGYYHEYLINFVEWIKNELSRSFSQPSDPAADRLLPASADL